MNKEELDTFTDRFAIVSGDQSKHIQPDMAMKLNSSGCWIRGGFHRSRRDAEREMIELVALVEQGRNAVSLLREIHDGCHICLGNFDQETNPCVEAGHMKIREILEKLEVERINVAVEGLQEVNEEEKAKV